MRPEWEEQVWRTFGTLKQLADELTTRDKEGKLNGNAIFLAERAMTMAESHLNTALQDIAKNRQLQTW